MIGIQNIFSPQPEKLQHKYSVFSWHTLRVELLSSFFGALFQVLIVKHSFVNSLLYPEQKALILKDEVFKVMSVCLAAEQAVKSKETVIIEYL